MKKIISSGILFFGLVTGVFSQTLPSPDNTRKLKITSSRIEMNLAGKTPFLVFKFKADMQGSAVEPAYFTSHPPRLHLVYQGVVQDEKCALKVESSLTPKEFGFKVSGFSDKTLQYFKAGDKQIKVAYDDDVYIQFESATGDGKVFGLVPKDTVNHIIDTLSFTEADRTKFVDAFSTYYYAKNKLDFSVQPATDSASTAYVVSFAMQKLYNPSGLLKCSTNASVPDIYWSISGRLSTHGSDTLNFINYYPLILAWNDFDFPGQMYIKAGHESSQTFDQRRFAVNAEYNFLAPNLVDLSTPGANRLRFKPVITLGLKGYYNYSKNLTAYSSGMGYLNGYYYIPVFTSYALILEGSCFYDFSKENNPSHMVKGNYSVTLGAEIPKTAFKAMFKYTNGKTDITYKEGQSIGIGLLMDLFQEKK